MNAVFTCICYQNMELLSSYLLILCKSKEKNDAYKCCSIIWYDKIMLHHPYTKQKKNWILCTRVDYSVGVTSNLESVIIYFMLFVGNSVQLLVH
jgi:hypothetical protein